MFYNYSVFCSGLRALSSTTQPWRHWALGGKTAAPGWREHGHLVHGLMLLSCKSSVVIVIRQRCFESVTLTHYSICCFVRAPADQLVSGWANADCTDCCLLPPRGFPHCNWGIRWEHLAIFFNHQYYYCYYFWNWQRNQFVLFVSQDQLLLNSWGRLHSTESFCEKYLCLMECFLFCFILKHWPLHAL